MENYVIGIGASAGGLKALKDFFKARQVSQGESYVIILHSLRSQQSHLVQILSRITSIPIQWIENNMPIEGNRIYVSQSHHKIEIKKRRFITSDRGQHEIINSTINYFFESLARDIKDKAIGIIMSGTGTDGTAGVHLIEDHGGLVLVQDPSTAEFDGMPLTSIKYDHPDYISHPEAMPALIDQIISGQEDKRKRKSISMADFQRLHRK
jgi:two-component system, chemotaxis family, CheB/CheR fusion protein